MRKIEKEMIAAIKARKDWKSGNTEVVYDECGARVYLHGNCIASTICNRFQPNNRIWSKWPTRTTASRLRALGFTYDKKSDRWN